MKMRVAMKICGAWDGRHRRTTMQRAWRRIGFNYEFERQLVAEYWKDRRTTNQMAKRFGLITADATTTQRAEAGERVSR